MERMKTFRSTTHMMSVGVDRIGDVRLKRRVQVDVELIYDPSLGMSWYHLWSDDLCLGGTGNSTSEAWKDLEDNIKSYNEAKDPIVRDLSAAISPPPKPTQVSPLYCPGKYELIKKREVICAR